MQIHLNGATRDVPSETTIAELLQTLDLDPRALAVERNAELVPRDRHEATRLEAGDAVEIVTLVGGG